MSQRVVSIWVILVLAVSSLLAQPVDTASYSVPAADSSALIWQVQVPPAIMGPAFTGEAPEPMLRSEVSDDKIHPREDTRQHVWVFAILVLQVVVVTIIRVFFGKNLNDQFRAATSLNLIEQLKRDQETSLPMSSVLLNYNAVVSVALFCYLVVAQSNAPITISGFSLFLVLIVTTLVLTSAKYFLMEFISWVFPFQEELQLYSFNLFLGYKLLGLGLLPVNIFLAYAPYQFSRQLFLGVSLLLFLVFVIQLVARGWMIGGRYWWNNKFHFIVYICTLEILPVAVLVKVAGMIVE